MIQGYVETSSVTDFHGPYSSHGPFMVWFLILKVQSLQHYPPECIPQSNPSGRGLIAVLIGLRAPDMVNGALICDFLLQSVENSPFLFWIQMHQKRANQLKTRK